MGYEISVALSFRFMHTNGKRDWATLFGSPNASRADKSRENKIKSAPFRRLD